MHDARIPYVTDAEVRRLLPMETAIALMREAFIQLAAGAAAVPVRTGLDLADAQGRALFMPAYLPGAGRFGVKVVSVHEGNPARGLPLIHALVLVFDAGTGRPVALVDGEALTAIRTGAASGLATDLLARPDASVAAIFGAGVQARTQLEAVCAVRPIRQAYVFGRTPARAARFAAEMGQQLGIGVRLADAPGRLREADVICTATTAVVPVFAPEDVRAGAHINAVGAYRPDMAEVPPETVRAARVVVDHRRACLAEAGDLLQPLRAGLIEEAHLLAELGEVAAGQRPGRTAPDQVTLFKSVGNAVQDLAAASYVAARAGSA